MRSNIILVLLLLTASTFGNQLQKGGKGEVTPEDLIGMFNAFIKGIRIEIISESTLICKSSVRQLIVDGTEAIEFTYTDNYWNGTLAIADVLAGTSPVARSCSTGIDELSTEIYNYINSFDTFESWTSQISANVASHTVQLILLSSQLVTEWKKVDFNLTLVGGYLGEIAFYTLTFNSTYPNLEYSRTDPLAPAPVNELLWTTLESFYEFFTNARLVNEATVTECQNNFLNILHFNLNAYNNIQASIIQEGIFLVLDSFTFLRPGLESCAATSIEIIDNVEVVGNMIATNPEQIRTNFKENLFHISSGSAAAYAQVYHRDVVSFFKVFGGLVYNTLVRE
jgi:hypothetical protein